MRHLLIALACTFPANSGATPIYLVTISPSIDSGAADALEVRVREFSDTTATGEVKRHPNKYRLVADLSVKAAAQVALMDGVARVSTDIGDPMPIDHHRDPAIQIIRFDRGLTAAQLQHLRERIATLARETESGYFEWFGADLMRANLTTYAARAVSGLTGVVSVEEEVLDPPGCGPTLSN